VDFVATVVADEQSLEVVQPGEGALHNPADAAESGAVLGLAAGDFGANAEAAELAPILVVVVAAVGGNAIGPPTRPADLAAYRRDPLDQRDQLRDVAATAPARTSSATKQRPGDECS
jgi:hypothetical protein